MMPNDRDVQEGDATKSPIEQEAGKQKTKENAKK